MDITNVFFGGVAYPNRINWDSIPAKYNYVSRDRRGVVRAHTAQPKCPRQEEVNGDDDTVVLYAFVHHPWVVKRPKPKIVPKHGHWYWVKKGEFGPRPLQYSEDYTQSLIKFDGSEGYEIIAEIEVPT